jgi:sugar lactone lactonase YvrE
MRFCIMVFLTLIAQPIRSEIITLAGNGTFGFSGDGGPATQAQLNRPTAIYADSLNNIYIADGNNGRIRKIDVNGIITTLAGSSTEGFSGDGGPATQAQLNRPHGIAMSPEGNIYISDTRNNRIRKIDANGIITTLAGTDTPGFSGDGGPATQAQLNRPHGIAIDKEGNIYIADTNNNRIRKIDVNGIITTQLENITGPASVAVDTTGILYIAERTGERILKMDTDGALTILAGNGQSGFSEDGSLATEAKLGGPRGIAVSNSVYFSDKANQRIRRITNTGTLVTEAGSGTQGDAGDNGPALSASLNFPWGIFVTIDKLYIADRENHRIRLVTLESKTTVPSDFNADQKVDFQDFILFATHFGATQTQEKYDAQFDIDNNGEIGFSDFLIFAQAFGK